MPILRFETPHICFLRPNKKTYHILQWCAVKRMWTPCTQILHQNDIRMFKSLLHTSEEVNIQLRLKLLRMRCDGFYLRVSDFEGRTVSRIIPICVKSPTDSFPPSYLKHPTPAPISTRIEHFLRRLWTSFDDTRVIPAQTEKRLPTRIASILAHDAATNGEVCPILHDVIVPETSAVTTCFHVFDRGSIETWLHSNTTCPVCKETCTVTPVTPVTARASH
jgi:hypothetical protein